MASDAAETLSRFECDVLGACTTFPQVLLLSLCVLALFATCFCVCQTCCCGGKSTTREAQSQGSDHGISAESWRDLGFSQVFSVQSDDVESGGGNPMRKTRRKERRRGA